MVFWDHLLLPFVAVFVLGVIDHRTRHGTLTEWLVNLGWDSCVLAAGAAPGVLGTERAVRWCGGPAYAVKYTIAFLFACVLFGLFVSGMKAAPYKSELDVIGSLALGGTLLGFLTYIVW